MAVNTRQAMKQLKDKDPEQRKTAIKIVARSKDRNVLRQLALMAGDDPDPEVRKLAQRAGVYIRQQIGELPVAEATSKDEKPNKGHATGKAAIDDKNMQKAQAELSAAMGALTRDEKAKMIKHLQKALTYNPNLKSDDYFKSLCETATGEAADIAVEKISTDGLSEDIAQKETEQKRQQTVEEHYEKIQKINWTGAAFDVTLFFIITLIGTMVVTFVMLESASAFLDRYEAQFTAWLNNEVDEDGEPIAPPIAEAGFQEFSESLRAIGLSQIFVNGLIAGFSSVVSLLLYCAAVHFSSRRFFGGEGTLPYLVHKWATLFATRSVALFIILTIGIAMVFSAGGGFVIFIVLGLAGLILLTTFLKAINLVAGSYQFSWAKAFVAVLVGGVLVAILNTVISVATGINIT